MKKHVSKKAFVAVVLAITFCCGMNAVTDVKAEAAQDTSVAVNVQVQQQAKGGVDWTKGADSDVTAIGVGLPPKNALGPQGRALARRAALVDAYRQLAETIQGVQIDSDTLMEDLTIKNDTVKAKVSALVKGARVIDEGPSADGSYYVKMRIPLFGVTDSVAAIAIPEIKKTDAPEPLPSVTKTNLPQLEVKEVKSAAFTGVIVDASGLGLESTFSPVIFDENGRGIYGMKNIDAGFAISRGMVEYATNRDTAITKSRAGAKPLVVKAVSVRGGNNSANKVNVVVSVNDGDKILLANENSNMLQNCAVVFVK